MLKWNEMKYGQKGGILGSFLGIVFYVNHILDIVAIKREIGDVSPLLSLEVLFIALPLISIPTLYGTVMGIIFSNIESMPNIKKIPTFLISMIVLGYLSYYIAIFLIVLIAKPY
jgi:hypothetical protein